MKRLASENARKIRRILIDGKGCADLYRTVEAGPSGQRADLLVGRVYYTDEDPFEVEIYATDGPFQGERSGYARRGLNGVEWEIFEDQESDGIRYIGTASTLSLGVDVLRNGAYAATRSVDWRRISPGRWRPLRTATA